MLKGFNTAIKPLNDDLGQKLGIRKIEVNMELKDQEVPVLLKHRTPQGKTIQIKNTELRFYRVLGLTL